MVKSTKVHGYQSIGKIDMSRMIGGGVAKGMVLEFVEELAMRIWFQAAVTSVQQITTQKNYNQAMFKN